MHFKDGAYYCYCAYVLRIFRYSNFLSPMLTNTGIFLRGLKLSGELRLKNLSEERKELANFNQSDQSIFILTRNMGEPA